MIILLFLSGCVEPQKFVSLENRVAAIEMENNRQLLKQKERSDESVIQNEQTQLKLKEDIGTIEKKLNDSHSISQEEYAELMRLKKFIGLPWHDLLLRIFREGEKTATKMLIDQGHTAEEIEEMFNIG